MELLNPLIIFLLMILIPISQSQSSLCRSNCGDIPINYPFGIDDGCGSPYYRHLLVCATAGTLLLQTPSGQYPIHSISYSDTHLLLTDPSMWTCSDRRNFRRTRLPFTLDGSTHFSLSPQNDYLFFNCSRESVIVEPRPIFCERFPDRCDSACDSASYLCRHLPGGCESALVGGPAVSCCSYYPKSTESLRMMLRYCATYTSVYWRSINGGASSDENSNQVAEYGIRVEFDIPVTTRCLQCQDPNKGGGLCGFDTETQDFSCLCKNGNVTTYCKGK